MQGKLSTSSLRTDRITRSALLSFAPPRHSRRPTQLQPRRNRSMNVVHLALRRLAALNSSLLHLLRHPRVPPRRVFATEVVGESLRTCAHPSPGLPLDIGLTPQLYVTNARITGVIRTDSNCLSVARRTCACLRQFGIDYSF